MDCIFEIRNKGLENYLVYWAKDGKQIDAAACELLRNTSHKAIESLEMITENSCMGVQYNIAYKATLRKYLTQDMSAVEVRKIFQAVIEAVRYIQEQNLSSANLYLNMDYIFIDFLTHELSFLYIPVTAAIEENISVLDFMKQLLITISYKKDEQDIMYLAKLLVSVSHADTFSLDELEQILQGENVQSNVTVQQQVVKPVMTPQPIITPQPAVTPQPVMAPQLNPVQPIIRPMEQETAVPTKSEVFSPVHKVNIEVAQPKSGRLINPNYKEETDGGTTVLKAPSSEGQMQDRNVLRSNTEDSVPKPFLIRTRTGEAIAINQEEFKLGKSADANYCITDNVAISRVHAIIYLRSGVCFLKDNDSTNRTYVNGEILKGDSEKLLLKGMKIMLADEEFTYDLR